jgi:hypothetical protein
MNRRSILSIPAMAVFGLAFVPNNAVSQQRGTPLITLGTSGGPAPIMGRAEASNLLRRDFIALLGGAAAAWPVRALAQQSKVPVIGYLSITGSPSIGPRRAAFRRGLSEAGHVEGRNAAIEFRTDDRLDRLPELAA